MDLERIWYKAAKKKERLGQIHKAVSLSLKVEPSSRMRCEHLHNPTGPCNTTEAAKSQIGDIGLHE